MADTYTKLTWDGTGTRAYHTGVDHVALYPKGANGYEKGVAWNGVTNVTKSADGGEPNAIWADNIKYGVLMSKESAKGTIKAFTFPKEWHACNGETEIGTGTDMYIGQQTRQHFGLIWREMVGDDTSAESYIYHVMYDNVATPAEMSNDTINDNPDAMEMSWDFESTPITETFTVGAAQVTKTTSTVDIPTKGLSQTKLTALEEKFFGNGTSADPTMPTLAEIYGILSAT